MRRLCWFVLALLLAAPAAEARGQDLLVGGPYGFASFGYSRRGLRAGGLLYGLAPFGPYSGTWGGPGLGRVTVFSVITPPPPPPPPPVVVIHSPTLIFDAPRLRPDDVPPMPRAAEPPPPPPKKEAAPPKKDEKDDPLAKLPRPPAEEADPRDEHARLVGEGREAFALEEYGRSALRLGRAARLLPAEPLPSFLLAQALMAQGKYHQAHDAVLAGLARRPDWPNSGFRPLELYGDGLVAYTEHLRALEEAVGRHPLDPVLLFLYGYALWFDGRPDEAAVYFRQALPRAADRKAIELFLLALPAGETL
jgi:hypothetical protein